MPIRTASLHRQIEKNGAKLHQAILTRIHSHGADDPPSDQEQVLMEERRILKEAQATRHAQALQPKPKAAKIAREAKPAKEPKAPKPPKEKAEKAPKAAKSAKPHISRAEKHAKKVEAVEAAKRAAKKSAKP
jgi:hypothetical protein